MSNQEEQTTQWPKEKYTKGVIRSVKLRRTDNTMTKRKRRQRALIYKSLQWKIRIKQDDDSTKNRD